MVYFSYMQNYSFIGETMNNFKKILSCLFFIFLLTAALSLCAHAEDISGKTEFLLEGGSASAALDRNESSFITLEKHGEITLRSEEGIAYVYILFDRVCGEWSYKVGNYNITAGQNGFLHELADIRQGLGFAPSELTLRFENGAKIAEIYVFSKGELPSFVQRWEPPCDKADLLLFSSHSDDEHLFFAGLLPTYAMAAGYRVQVVYFTNHWDTHERAHEQLNGLWKVGVRNYPIIPEFPDLYSESLEAAQSAFAAKGYTEDDFVEYYVNAIRRFCPLVVVGHDEKGEYGHGAHILNTHILKLSLPLAASQDYTRSPYEPWDVPKTYLHLYPENGIVLNYDIPLEALSGKTAFEVSREGYLEHKSQHWMWFYRWMMGEDGNRKTASSISSYSPCEYGLYRSTVGKDVIGDDLFENLVARDAQTAVPDTSDTVEVQDTEQAGGTDTETPPAVPTPERKPWALYVVFGALACAVLTLILAKRSKK